MKRYMKNYLELIPVQAKLHRRESRMTRICIFLSVFLVMAIFGMADMEMQSLRLQTIRTDGAWHAAFFGLTDEQTAMLAARPEVKTLARYDALNYRLDEGWQVEGIQTVICGFDSSLMEFYPAAEVTEGWFPKDISCVVCTDSMKDRLGLQIGDTITVVSKEGVSTVLTVSGFSKATSMIQKADAFGLFVNMESFRSNFSEGEGTGKDFQVYVELKKYCNIRKTLADIKEQFGLSDDQVGENAKLLGLMFQSSDPYLMQIYLVAAVLAALVSTAGILMITGSLNSSVAQRTEFFGLMRCLGATPKQVIRFVRREALGWCKSAIPLAIAAGTVVIWFLCGLLRAVSPGLFEDMPVLGMSLPGMAAGTLIGLVTVLLAARAPARRASKVQPLTAVSGRADMDAARPVKRTVGAGAEKLPIDVALGIHHAGGSLKNFLLMTGSFAFGIILFLSFGTLKDFMEHALVPLRPWSADISVISPDHTCSLSEELIGDIAELPAVKRVYGRRFSYGMTAQAKGQTIHLDLISYEEYQFRWAEDFLESGIMQEAEEGRGVLVVQNEEFSLDVGDTIELMTENGYRDLPVSAVVSSVPFDSEAGTMPIVCSDALFEALTGETGYTVVDVQLKRSASDRDAKEIRSMAGETANFSDSRQSNLEITGVYYAFLLFLYGFLAVILMICAFHIINSMSMSVSARIREYQSLYAIGMSKRQIIRMTAAEAFSYTLFGIAGGSILGLYMHRLLFGLLVTTRWGTPWQIPLLPLATVTGAVLLSACLSLAGPVRRIQKISGNPDI